MKLILGLAGLGGNEYGRKKRKVWKTAAQEIMKHAYENGIRECDSSSEYGHATAWASDLPFTIYHKTQDPNLVSNDPHIIYLHHNWCAYDDAKYAGASVYAEDLEVAARTFSLVQVEWSVLRQTEVQDVPKNTTIHARSTLLQGILAGATPPYSSLNPFLEHVSKAADSLGVDTKTFAIRAALENPHIAKVVVGPQTIKELNECLEIEAMPRIGAYDYLEGLDAPRHLTDPRTWP